VALVEPVISALLEEDAASPGTWLGLEIVKKKRLALLKTIEQVKRSKKGAGVVSVSCAFRVKTISVLDLRGVEAGCRL